MIRATEFLKSCLALQAWREAHQYGGAAPMLMVAQTISNRVRAGWGTWSHVLGTIEVHSSRLATDQPMGQPDVSDVAFQQLLQGIDQVYDGTVHDLTTGALYWADLAEIRRDWFLLEIVRKPEDHPRLASTSTLTFWG